MHTDNSQPDTHKIHFSYKINFFWYEIDSLAFTNQKASVLIMRYL